jgi:hypothetical protein
MNVIGILMGIALNLYIDFGNQVIFAILILPIHKHGRSSYLLSLFRFLSSVVCSFHCRSLSHLLLSLFLGIFFMNLLHICTSSFERCLFSSFAHVLVGLFVILVFHFLSSLCILDINPLSDEYPAGIFSHSLGCLFTLLIVYFAVQKLLHLIQFHLFFTRIFCAIRVVFRK